MNSRGIVFLVGAGPGDAGLLTRRGAELLADADCVVYDGLVSDAVMALVPAKAASIYAGKKRAEGRAPLSQAEINALLVERARRGERVVRLKGGDPFVYGRGAEEVMELAAAGIEFEIVPGVSAATAVAAYAGVPLTMRGVTSTVTLVTGHEAPDKPGTDVDWSGVARSGTIVLFMALSTLESCARSLEDAGRDPSTPCAAIYWGTTGSQRTVISTLSGIAEACTRAALRPPVLVVIGEVVGRRDDLSWFEKKPLFGKRIAITRSGSGAERVARDIRERGGDPLIMPLTATEACADEAALNAAFSKLDARGYDWVVFASANAVRFFFDAVRQRQLDARVLAGARVAAVGQKTAASLEKAGIRADLIPARGDAAALAQSIAAVATAASTVLVPSAAASRPELAEGLRRAGHSVDALSIYRTVSVSVDDVRVRLAARRLQSEEVDGVLFFAPSQVRAFSALFGDHTAVILSSVSVIGAIGRTTASALAAIGVSSVVVAEEPSGEDLVRAITERLRDE